MHGLKQKKHNGFGLIEIVVSVGIVGTVLSGVFFFYQKSLFINQRTTMLVQTNMLLVEGVEVVKFLRDDSWSTNITSFPTSTPQYLVFTSGDWEVVSTSTQIDNVFTRWFVLEDVYRDGNDDIAASGTYDPNTLKLSMHVSASLKGSTTTESIQTYIVDLFEN